MPRRPGQSRRRARRDVLRTARAMASSGLVTGSSGNVSQRFGDGFLITPAGIAYDHLASRQIVRLDAEGTKTSGRWEPSSEWRLHIAIYRDRPDVEAIVHTHSVHATAASLVATELPVGHDEGRLLFGERISVSQHAPPGTWDLVRAVVRALGEARGALIARHGVVAVGRTVDEALEIAIKIDEAARLIRLARQLDTPRAGAS